MIPILLLLRLKQLMRVLVDLGFVRSVILVGIIIFFILNLNSYVNQKPWIVVSSFIIVMFSNHARRKDKDFLFKIAPIPWVIYLVEYVIIASPFLFLLIKNEIWTELLASSIVLILIPFGGKILQLENKIKVNSFPFFPLASFEWRSGFRTSGPMIILVYLIAIVFANYSSTIPIALLIMAIINTSFYLECEPRQMLELYELSPKGFIKLKIVNQLLLFWIPCIPLLVVYIIAFSGFWFVNLIMIVVCSVIQILAITLKYNSYIPRERLGMNSFIIALSIVCFMVPFLSPIPFILIIRSYRKAAKTLNEYLYAPH